jgi:hypothetical protein
LAGTVTEHGVLQLGPTDVTASAPDGTESSCTVTVGGADLKASNDIDEQPAKLKLAAAITNTLRMLFLPILMRLRATVPRAELRGVAVPLQPAWSQTLIFG